MKSESSIWVKTIQNGLIGGGIALLLALIGMVEAFNKTYIIVGFFTMAHVFLFAPILFEAYTSVSKANTKKTSTLLAIGGLAGLVGGLVLAALILLQQVLNLRAVFINLSPTLIGIMTFNVPLPLGLLVLLVVCLLLGMVSTGLFLLPVRIRGRSCRAS